jgi:hypothetical protein
VLRSGTGWAHQRGARHLQYSFWQLKSQARAGGRALGTVLGGARYNTGASSCGRWQYPFGPELEPKLGLVLGRNHWVQHSGGTGDIGGRSCTRRQCSGQHSVTLGASGDYLRTPLGLVLGPALGDALNSYRRHAITRGCTREELMMESELHWERHSVSELGTALSLGDGRAFTGCHLAFRSWRQTQG